MNLYELILGALIGLSAGAIVVGLTLFVCSQWERWFPSNGGVLPQPPKNPYTAGSNDILKEMAERIQNRVDEKIAQHLVARPPSYQIGPAERVVTIPKDVRAELQAMPNDGSWSTRQLVRAIQRANKKKRGAP